MKETLRLELLFKNYYVLKKTKLNINLSQNHYFCYCVIISDVAG